MADPNRPSLPGPSRREPHTPYAPPPSSMPETETAAGAGLAGYTFGSGAGAATRGLATTGPAPASSVSPAAATSALASALDQEEESGSGGHDDTIFDPGSPDIVHVPNSRDIALPPIGHHLSTASASAAQHMIFPSPDECLLQNQMAQHSSPSGYAYTTTSSYFFSSFASNSSLPSLPSRVAFARGGWKSSEAQRDTGLRRDPIPNTGWFDAHGYDDLRPLRRSIGRGSSSGSHLGQPLLCGGSSSGAGVHTNQIPPVREDIWCKLFKSGFCHMGDSCRLAHSKREAQFFYMGVDLASAGAAMINSSAVSAGDKWMHQQQHSAMSPSNSSRAATVTGEHTRTVSVRDAGTSAAVALADMGVAAPPPPPYPLAASAEGSSTPTPQPTNNGGAGVTPTDASSPPPAAAPTSTPRADDNVSKVTDDADQSPRPSTPTTAADQKTMKVTDSDYPPLPAPAYLYAPPAAPAPAGAMGMGSSSPRARAPAPAAAPKIGERKTLLCENWQMGNKTCGLGDACWDAHDERYQLLVPGRRGGGGEHSICNDFFKNRWCRFGANCKYSHRRS